ncbi:hypothetical protein OHC33_006255 [Knufia fluminis]|uniref:DUF1275 domain protein n=1 Tax=Knufia fluminis TaxID=191047 RepID=A0AAN8EUW1_9EURO|nr:hypothetical protein OHC33_006255 [Knufia fluminis]
MVLAHFSQSISRHHTIYLLYACFFASGGVFANLQTGNTIVVAVRTAGKPLAQHRFAFLKSIAAVISYSLGATVFNLLHRKIDAVGPDEEGVQDGSSSRSTRNATVRWKLMLSFLIQAICIAVAAVLAQRHIVSNQKISDTSQFSSGNERNPAGAPNYLDLLPIALLAFEAAGQVCLSRVLSFADLPTIVISTLYHDHIADSLFLSRDIKIAREEAAKSSGDQFTEPDQEQDQASQDHQEKSGKRKTFWHNIWLVSNGRQKRQVYRTVCIVCLVAGATTGAQVGRYGGGVWAALWVAVGVKVSVLGAVRCWAAEG